MGDDALIKNVFGSDSDSDDDAAAAAPPAGAPTEDAGAAKGDDAEGEVHADADPIPDADDAERDGADPDRPPGFKSSLEENLSDEEQEDDDKEEEKFGERSPRSGCRVLPRARAEGFAEFRPSPRTHARLTARPPPQTHDRDAGPPLEINANLYDPIPPTTTAKLVRLTNVVGVETEPFDPETYQPQEDTFVDNEGKTRISTPFTNIIRWRKVIDPETGEEKVESNARMVKWSDGSWQLLIGSEAFNVTETDLGDRNEYLFARHPGAGLIQGQKKISSKLAFTPANLNSATHRQLTRAIDTRHVKTKQTQKFIAVTDPEREKAAVDAEAERVMKEQDAAKKRQSAAMGGGGRAGKIGRGYTEDYYAKYADEEDALDGDFLEASDEDSDGGEAEAVAERVAEKRKAGGPGGFEDEEGMSSDDGVGEKAAGVKRKRGRVTIESDSD